MKLYTHNGPAALCRADVVAHQEIRLKAKDNVVCAQMHDKEGREYQRECAQGVPLLVR